MRKPTYRFYKKKIQAMLKNEYKYLFTGVFIVAAIGTFTFLQVRHKNILGVFTFDSTEDSAIAVSEKTNEILKVVVSKSIDYVSPQALNKQQNSSGLSRPEENGQISAIASAKVTNTDKEYVVQPGDSLASIALQVYGDVNAWIRIAQANNISDPDAVEVGMTLTIPR